MQDKIQEMENYKQGIEYDEKAIEQLNISINQKKIWIAEIEKELADFELAQEKHD